ncbi:MAG: ATP synthase F1 subunit epsilon [Clostridia bacterium]|nr:ATP synthase F1 subunit epsilon [Clostridia bacterium]
MTPFYLKVVASDKVFYDGMCVSLVVPIDDGNLGVLAHHENEAMVISSGEISIHTENDEVIHGFVGDGFMEILNGEVTVVVLSAEKPEDIDDVRAREALERAKEELKREQSYIEHEHSVASLARATHRLELKNKYKK